MAEFCRLSFSQSFNLVGVKTTYKSWGHWMSKREMFNSVFKSVIIGSSRTAFIKSTKPTRKTPEQKVRGDIAQLGKTQ